MYVLYECWTGDFYTLKFFYYSVAISPMITKLSHHTVFGVTISRVRFRDGCV